jgi:hypothetical protein
MRIEEERKVRRKTTGKDNTYRYIYSTYRQRGDIWNGRMRLTDGERERERERERWREREKDRWRKTEGEGERE